MDQILKQLQLDNKEIDQKDKSATVELDDAREYSKVFSRLSSNSDFWENEEAGYLDLDGCKYVFENNDFSVELIGEFVDDKYTVVIKEI